MMKIAYCSDLHLEFGKLTLKNEEKADVLVLAGDVCLARHMDFDMTRYEMSRGTGLNGIFYDFFKNVSEEFAQVIYVVGNHEHYSYDFKYTVEEIKRNLKAFPNITLLDKECKQIDDVLFVGGTLWTDMNNGDPATAYFVKHRMNDFKNISNSARITYRKVPLYQKDEHGYILDDKGFYIKCGEKMKEEPSTFSVEDSVEENKKCLDYIRIATEGKDKVVVVTHHTPSYLSCHPAYAADVDMNHAYHNKLDEFIEDRPQIKLWFHGHTHNEFNYTIGECSVLCNPRGYHKYEQIAKEFKLKYVEI